MPATHFCVPLGTQFLVDTKVLSQDELSARYHVAVERYVKTIEIELNTLVEMASVYIIPAVETQLLKTGAVFKELVGPVVKDLHKERLAALESAYSDILTHHKTLIASINSVHVQTDEAKKMKALAASSLPVALKLREACDRSEGLVADDLWPLPKYREMLFTNTLT